MFDESTYQFEVTENTDVLDPDISVHATDIDIGQNANISYEIISGNRNDTFVIGKLGYYKVNIHYYDCSESVDTYGGAIRRNPLNQINREFQSRYDLVIIAHDNGVPERNDTATVIIDILVRHKSHL